MKINGREIEFQTTPPKKEGKFLWRGTFLKELILITVITYPEKFYGGLPFPAYLGVLEFGGRPINNLKGEFVELENE